MYLEASLKRSLLRKLADQEEISTWTIRTTRQLRLLREGAPPSGEDLKGSLVHRRAGDVLDLSRRRSYGQSGRSPEVLETLAKQLLPQLREAAFPETSCLELYEGHYDLVAYGAGGFFSKHSDYVSAFGPGLRCWHLIYCLSTPGCVGGKTRVYEAGAATAASLSTTYHDSDATTTPGSCLAILGATPHEGLPVEEGMKFILKCSVYEFYRPSAVCDRALLEAQGQPEAWVRCICSDGELQAPLRCLMRQPFFRRLVAFEGPRENVQLRGLCVEDLRVLLAYLSDSEEVCYEERAVRLKGVLGYILAPEDYLTTEELRDLSSQGLLRTEDPATAERWSSLEGPEYVFLGVLHEWSVAVQNIWDLFLDLPEKQLKEPLHHPQLCVVSGGDVVLEALLPGRCALTEASARTRTGSLQIKGAYTTHQLCLYQTCTSPPPGGSLSSPTAPPGKKNASATFRTMREVLRRNVCERRPDAEESTRPEQLFHMPTGDCRSHEGADSVNSDQVAGGASVEEEGCVPSRALLPTPRQGRRIVVELARSLTPEQLKALLKAHCYTSETKEVFEEEACNDGESYLTTTLYQTRIFKQEWVVFRARELQREDEGV